MNGRVYDPQLGRFLSADPTVAYPESTQGLNRYSYTDNNPLSRVDLNGYSWWSDRWKAGREVITTVAAIAIAVYAPQMFSALPTFAANMAGGFISGAVTSGGDLKMAMFSAFTAGLFTGIGNFEAVGAGQRLGKIVGHGLIGGFSQEMTGGDFRAGFWSVAMTQSFSGWINHQGGAPGPGITRTAYAAIIGGTASVMGGGKFANGAKTFAFLRLFSEAADYYERSVGRAASLRPGKNRPGQTTYDPDPKTGQQLPQDWDMNVVGNNDLTSFCRQGSACSKALNLVPFIAPTAGLHDYWFNMPGHPEQTFINNVGTMLPAAAISTGAVLGNLTQGWDSNPALMFYLTMPRD